MTRSEHLDWAKKRALELIDAGDNNEALASMLSDCRKHPELENHAGCQLGVMLMMGGFLSDREEMRKWVVGFN